MAFLAGAYGAVPSPLPLSRGRRSVYKSWGELSGYRKELARRNKAIIEEYRRGVSIEKLADKYYLSIYAIRKIIYQK